MLTSSDARMPVLFNRNYVYRHAGISVHTHHQLLLYCMFAKSVYTFAFTGGHGVKFVH